jgi:anthranilate phosphoribosyltransferase
MSITPQEALQRTIEHREIFHDEMLHLMRMIMRGEMSPVMTAAIITGLRVKKETIGEITAAAQVMREFSQGAGADKHAPGRHRRHRRRRCQHLQHLHLLHVRDRRGRRQGQQARRARSSKSGSADAMEALGVNINLTPAQIASASASGHRLHVRAQPPPGHEERGAGAQGTGRAHHLQHPGAADQPGGAPNILMGVFHPDLVGIQVRALQRLGAEHALVVYGRDGMDEISLGAGTLVGELKDGVVREYEIHPEDFGLRMAGTRALRWRTPRSPRPCCWACCRARRPGARHRLPERRRALYAANVAPPWPRGCSARSGRWPAARPWPSCTSSWPTRKSSRLRLRHEPADAPIWNDAGTWIVLASRCCSSWWAW